MIMKKILTLIIGLLILTPCASFGQPKAQRLIKRAKTHALSEKAVKRSAKEALILQEKRAAGLIKRQEEQELKALSEQVGQRIRGRANSALKVRYNSLNEQQALRFDPDFTVNPKTIVYQALDNNPRDIMAALSEMQKLRSRSGDDANPAYFQLFSTLYYKKNLKVMTPHMKKFFEQVANRNSNSLEKDVILRMKKLFAQKHLLSTKGLGHVKQNHLRLRYLKNVDQVNDLNFSPDELIFAFEQPFSEIATDFSIGHIGAYSRVIVDHYSIPLRSYDYDLDTVTELYKQLLTADRTGKGITVVFDQKSRNLAIHSPNKQVWLRITPHEYASPRRLHIHLNEVRQLTFSTSKGRQFNDRVLFNVSIPIFWRATISPKTGEQYDLYEKMILSPVYKLGKDKNVTVIKGKLF